MDIALFQEYVGCVFFIFMDIRLVCLGSIVMILLNGRCGRWFFLWRKIGLLGLIEYSWFCIGEREQGIIELKCQMLGLIVKGQVNTVFREKFGKEEEFRIEIRWDNGGKCGLEGGKERKQKGQIGLGSRLKVRVDRMGVIQEE